MMPSGKAQMFLLNYKIIQLKDHDFVTCASPPSHFLPSPTQRSIISSSNVEIATSLGLYTWQAQYYFVDIPRKIIYTMSIPEKLSYGC